MTVSPEEIAKAEQDADARARKLAEPWLKKLLAIDAKHGEAWQELRSAYADLEGLFLLRRDEILGSREKLLDEGLAELGSVNGAARQLLEDARGAFNADQVDGPLPSVFHNLVAKLRQEFGHVPSPVTRVYRSDVATSAGWGSSESTFSTP